MSLEFDNEEDFDATLYQLVELGLVHENKCGDTLYKLTFAEWKIRYAIPHVTLFWSEKDEPVLRIEDYELYDTFEDIINEEFDLEYDYLNREEKNGIDICTMYFNKTVDKEKLDKAVRSLDQEEVERIFRINNPK